MGTIYKNIKGFLIYMITEKIPGLEQCMLVSASYRYADEIEASCGLELDLEEKNDLMLEWCGKKMFVKIIQIILFPCIFAFSWMFCGSKSLFLMPVYLFIGDKKVEQAMNDLLGIG